MKHGMTIGELGLLFNEEMNIKHPNLKIIKIQGWEKRLPVNQYKNYGWILPSPNIPNFESSLFYPGTVLFESSHNVSLGRGTTKPFQIFGAPHFNSISLLNRIRVYERTIGYEKYFKGIKIISHHFLPTTSYHSGKYCNGFAIICLDENAIEDPIGLGLTLYKATLDLYRTTMDIKPQFFRLLTGNAYVFEMLMNGTSVPIIMNSFKNDLDDFIIRRRKYLIY